MTKEEKAWRKFLKKWEGQRPAKEVLSLMDAVGSAISTILHLMFEKGRRKRMKYIVIDEHKDGYGDVFTKEFDDKASAIEEAKNQWDYLTTQEKKQETFAFWNH